LRFPFAHLANKRRKVAIRPVIDNYQENRAAYSIANTA
jgi:hypothetical protein